MQRAAEWIWRDERSRHPQSRAAGSRSTAHAPTEIADSPAERPRLCALQGAMLHVARPVVRDMMHLAGCGTCVRGIPRSMVEVVAARHAGAGVHGLGPQSAAAQAEQFLGCGCACTHAHAHPCARTRTHAQPLTHGQARTRTRRCARSHGCSNVRTHTRTYPDTCVCTHARYARERTKAYAHAAAQRCTPWLAPLRRWSVRPSPHVPDVDGARTSSSRWGACSPA